MITHICAENIREYRGRMYPGLTRALSKTTLGEFWDIPSLDLEVLSGGFHGFYQHESGYSGIYSFGITPLAKELFFFWSGKNPEVPGEVNYSEVDAHLVNMALLFNCTHISCSGRVGWKKILEPLGYSPDGSLYIKRQR